MGTFDPVWSQKDLRMEWRQTRVLARTSAGCLCRESLCIAEFARAFWTSARVSWFSEYPGLCRATLLSGRGVVREGLDSWKRPSQWQAPWANGSLFVYMFVCFQPSKLLYA